MPAYFNDQVTNVISGSIGFSGRDFFLVRVQEDRYVALGGVPAEFSVECGG
jgi:hypothetical protein